jgi:hypothetical protein
LWKQRLKSRLYKQNLPPQVLNSIPQGKDFVEATIKIAPIQTKPASAGFKYLAFLIVRAGGLCLCSRDFNRSGIVCVAAILIVKALFV